MKSCKVEVNLPRPSEVYQYANEYRVALKGEYFLVPTSINGVTEVRQAVTATHLPVFIMKKLPWRPAHKTRYYYVYFPDFYVGSDIYMEGYSEGHDERLERGNFFLKKEEAQAVLAEVMEAFSENAKRLGVET